DAGRERALVDECEAARVVKQERRIVGLGGEGTGHAHRFRALLEDAESRRERRSGSREQDERAHCGAETQSSSPAHAFDPPGRETACIAVLKRSSKPWKGRNVQSFKNLGPP